MCNCEEHISEAEGHPHAELMMQYAEDAKKHPRPWELWEHYSYLTKNWLPIVCHPLWDKNCEYRRKPRTININGYEVPEPVRHVITDRRYFIAMVDLSKNHAIYTPTIIPSEEHLRRGIIHTTREAAELHAKALLSFTQQED